MLAGLGWQEGRPLGLSPDARVEPIPFSLKQDFLGLGKLEQDSELVALTVGQRRDLDSERQAKESAEQRKLREERVALQADLQQEISATLRPFYCQLCDKQFKTVIQYDEHTNSYAHHHKARAKDMQASLKPKAYQATVSLRQEKERLREERTLKKMAKAAGVKVSGNTTSSVVRLPAIDNAKQGQSAEPNTPSEPRKKISGWAKVGQEVQPTLHNQGASVPGTASISTKGRPSPSPETPPPPPPPPDRDSPPPPPPG